MSEPRAAHVPGDVWNVHNGLPQPMRTPVLNRILLESPFRGIVMSFDFEDLRSHFQIVRKQFEEAETLEEKQRLVAISQQIIRAANSEIEESSWWSLR